MLASQSRLPLRCVISWTRILKTYISISGAVGVWPPSQSMCLVQIENDLSSHVLTDFHTLGFSCVSEIFLGENGLEFGAGQPRPEPGLGL